MIVIKLSGKLKGILVLATLIMSMNLIALVNGASVTPTHHPDWQSGNANNECEEAGCTLSNYAIKIEDWGSGKDGTYSHELCKCEIEIKNSDTYTFEWESDCIVYCVIVVGGGEANVFYYGPDGATSDTGLYAPLNTNTPAEDDTFGISHVTFCYLCPPDLVIPETPLGTISTAIAMLGAVLLLRVRTIPIK